jgi:hypothetical protein
MFLEYAKLILSEYTNVSMIRRNKFQKRAAFAGRASVNIAKERNKAMYLKYQRKRMEYMRMKQIMAKRYKAQAARQARMKFR